MDKKAIATIFLVLGIGLVVVAAGLGIGYYVLFKDSIVPATLKYNSGEVSVDSGNGYNKIIGDVPLNLNSKIKTGADGSATLVLFESSLTTLYPNTELSIDKLVAESPKLKQMAGTTWNKFTSLSGMKTMEIETPTSVATVRGTSYEVSMEGIKVMEGNVGVNAGGNSEEVGAGYAFMNEDGTWTKRELTPEEKAELLKKMESDLSAMKELRLDIVAKHQDLYEKAKEQGKFTDEQRDAYLDQIDSGARDPEADYAQVPVKHPTVDRLLALSKEIRAQQQMIQSLQ